MKTKPVAVEGETRARFPAVPLSWKTVESPAKRSAPAVSNPTFAESVAAPARRRSRLHRGYLVAMAISAALHGGVLLLFNDQPAPAAPTDEADVDLIEIVAMPPLEPETPVEIVEMDASEPMPEFAPPMKSDLPVFVPDVSFTQQIRPELPPANPGLSAMTIIPSLRSGLAQGTPIKLFDFSELDHVPRRLRTVMPTYPTEMKRARIQGEVLLILIIDENGRVHVENVAEFTTREFANAAVTAVEQCVFEAPIKNGQRVRARYSMRVPFVLQ